MASWLNRMRLARLALTGKASVLGPAIARLQLDRPVWPQRDYAKYAQEAYQQNPIVYACIALRIAAVCEIPFVVYKGRDEKRKEIEGHPLLKLLERPNLTQDRCDLLGSLITQDCITGNGYLERTSEDGFERMELYSHRADRMAIIPGPFGVPRAYEYRVNGSVTRIPVGGPNGDDDSHRPVLHYKRYNPLDDWLGQSPLDPVAWAIDVHNEGWAWNKALLMNSGAPSGAFVYSGGEYKNEKLPDDIYERMKEELRQEVQGSANAGRPLLLEGGVDWKQMGFNPEQMQQEKALNNAARTICFALGVPPMLAGIPGDNTYSNYQEANRAFYRQTAIPEARRICRALSRWFEHQLGEDTYLDVNIDELDALSEERKDQWDRYEKSTILSLNEKRQAVGYDKVTGGDAHYVGAGQVPLDTPDTVTGEAAPEDAEDDPKSWTAWKSLVVDDDAQPAKH